MILITILPDRLLFSDILSQISIAKSLAFASYTTKIYNN